MSRETTWRSLCVQADPDFNRMSRMVVEYRFSAPGGKSGTGNERTHDGSERIFLGDYQTRGPYAAETVVADGITWNGIPVTWDADPVTWDD